jgi:hypothetical protein
MEEEDFEDYKDLLVLIQISTTLNSGHCTGNGEASVGVSRRMFHHDKVN